MILFDQIEIKTLFLLKSSLFVKHFQLSKTKSKTKSKTRTKELQNRNFNLTLFQVTISYLEIASMRI
jgi:hypothetical protein